MSEQILGEKNKNNENLAQVNLYRGSTNIPKIAQLLAVHIFE